MIHKTLIDYIELAETNIKLAKQTVHCNNCGKSIRKTDLEHEGKFVHDYSRFECPFCLKILNVPVSWLK